MTVIEGKSVSEGEYPIIQDKKYNYLRFFTVFSGLLFLVSLAALFIQQSEMTNISPFYLFVFWCFFLLNKEFRLLFLRNEISTKHFPLRWAGVASLFLYLCYLLHPTSFLTFPIMFAKEFCLGLVYWAALLFSFITFFGGIGLAFEFYDTVSVVLSDVADFLNGFLLLDFLVFFVWGYFQEKKSRIVYEGKSVFWSLFSIISLFSFLAIFYSYGYYEYKSVTILGPLLLSLMIFFLKFKIKKFPLHLLFWDIVPALLLAIFLYSYFGDILIFVLYFFTFKNFIFFIFNNRAPSELFGDFSKKRSENSFVQFFRKNYDPIINFLITIPFLYFAFVSGFIGLVSFMIDIFDFIFYFSYLFVLFLGVFLIILFIFSRERLFGFLKQIKELLKKGYCVFLREGGWDKIKKNFSLLFIELKKYGTSLFSYFRNIYLSVMNCLFRKRKVLLAFFSVCFLVLSFFNLFVIPRNMELFEKTYLFFQCDETQKTK